MNATYMVKINTDFGWKPWKEKPLGEHRHGRESNIDTLHVRSIDLICKFKPLIMIPE
jgi:hypothetical protein